MNLLLIDIFIIKFYKIIILIKYYFLYKSF